MIRTARIFPPLIALAMASVLAVANPSSPHAQVIDVPIAVPEVRVEPLTIDVVEQMRTALRHKAKIVGRVGDGLGYVVLNSKLAFYIRPQPNGQVRISQASVSAVTKFARDNGQRI